MKRFLCAVLIASPIFVTVFGLAQHAYSQAEWPDVPEITEEAPPPDTPVPLSTPSGWPGTGQPQPFTPAPASSAAGSAPDSNATAAQRTGSSDDTPERRATWTGPSVVPPLPERLNGQTTASSDDVDANEAEAVARAAPAAEAPEPAATASTQQSAGDAETDGSTADTDATSAMPAGAGASQDVVSSEAAADTSDAAGPQPSPTAAPAAQGQTDPAPKAENAAQPSGGSAAASRQSGAALEASTVPGAGRSQDATAAKVETSETAPAGQAEAARTAPASGDDSAPIQNVAVSTVEPAKPSAQPAKTDDGLDKIIGQMLLVAFDGINEKEEGPRRTRAQIESCRIGGVLFTSSNVQNVRQLTDLAHSFKNTASALPPFVAVTHEGGAGQPLSAEKGFSAYPSAGALGSANDPLNAFTVYQRMAEKLAEYGFNVNLGPRIDIQPTTDTGASPDESHSYGSTPKHVVAFAKAFRLAHQQNGILTVLKHFPLSAREPGRSDDVSAGSAEKPDPLQAFREMIASENADLIMTGHVADPHLSDEPDLPVSHSVTEQLRDNLKFEGVVLSGDLASPELAKEFPLKDRVLRAINAGADVLLFAGNADDADMPGEIAEIIREAVARGKLERARLEASYERITRLKQSPGLAAQAVAATKGNSAN